MKEIEKKQSSLVCLICEESYLLIKVNDFLLCKNCFDLQKKEQINLEKKRKNFFPEISKISEKLYLGNYDGQREKDILKKLGVTNVLACGSLLEDLNEGEFVFLQLELYDFNNEDLFKILKKALIFIDSSDKVYVHCHAGISRSAAVVIAFFMWKEKMEFKKALNYVRSKRSCIFPNSGFYKQLENFEVLLEQNNFNLDFLLD